MDPQTQQEFISLREYLERQFGAVHKRLSKLEQENAVRKARNKFVNGLVIASFPVALSALIAVLFAH